MARYYPWLAIIRELRRTPGVWVLKFPDRPALLARNIRQRRAPELHQPDGRIDVALRNAYTKDGRRRGDVWVRWLPEQGTPAQEDP